MRRTKLVVVPALVVAAVAVIGAACPKKSTDAKADAGAHGLQDPGGKLGHVADDFTQPHGIHGAVSRSTIATSPMTAPVVTVEDVTFTHADLERAISQHAVVAGIPPGSIDAVTRDALEQPAYDKMIERKLLADEAKRRGVWPSDDDVKKQTDELLATLPKGKTLKEVLAEMNSDEAQFKADVASDVAIGKLFELLKKEQPAPDDAALKKVYEENKDKFVIPDSASAMHILVAVAKDAPPDDQKKALDKIKAIKKEVAGKDEATFKKVASEKSDDPSAKENGGDLGSFAKGDMVKAFEDAAFKLKAGELSEPIRSDFGWHVIRGGGFKKGGQKTFDEMKQMIGEREQMKGFMQKVDDMIDGLRKKAKITRVQEPLASPLSGDDNKGTRVPAWKPTGGNADPGAKNPHNAAPPPPPPAPVPPGAKAG